ncbi:hypothetical protein TWF730_003376 [Orbilia blumenaviensis]|uniref:Uncharacterized protein n=1 Tax=Orbilia blumenaviensis TaxID=1796055 RepID=A0AAV9U9J3_9PEZI
MVRTTAITLSLLYYASLTSAGKWPYGDLSDSFQSVITCQWNAKGNRPHRNQFPISIMGESNEPPGVGSHDKDGAGLGWMAFTGPECKVGMWERGLNNELGRWELPDELLKANKPASAEWYACYPFHMQGSGDCYNLNTGLAGEVSSFIVTGYCECEFFGEKDCNNGLFGAFNRADGSLKTNGKHNDYIQSIRCVDSKQLDRWKGGHLSFLGAGKSDHVMVQDAIMPEDEGWNKVGGFSGCRVMPPEVQDAGGVHKVKINGISCMFFDNYECKHPAIFWEGSMGRVTRSTGLDGNVKSYRCFAPWGIGYHKRDDGMLPEPN